jgi:hypothetical protein
MVAHMETETPAAVTAYLEGRLSATRRVIRHNFEVVALPGMTEWALIRTDPGKGSRYVGTYADKRNAISDGVRGVGR